MVMLQQAGAGAGVAAPAAAAGRPRAFSLGGHVYAGLSDEELEVQRSRLAVHWAIPLPTAHACMHACWTTWPAVQLMHPAGLVS
jgi:hypothetical protein